MREARASSALHRPPEPAPNPPASSQPSPSEPPAARPEPIGPVEEIAQAYLATTHGDAGIALRCAITDALSDLLEAERRARENSRLISRGYVRDWRG